MRTWKGEFGSAALVVALLVAAVPMQAAAEAFPRGGGAFDGSAEGWQVTSATCDVPNLCTASGGYDADHGNPKGSLKADTNLALGLLTLFHSTVTLQSPDFEVAEGGAAVVHSEREFDPGSLVDVAPRLSYSIQLVDRTSGKRSTSISEVVEGASSWQGEDGAADVKAGHTYALLITAGTYSRVAGTGLFGGMTSARFDNVALTVGSSVAAVGGSGGRESHGAAGITDARLAALAPAAISGPAQLRGRRLSVKARCPRSIGQACRVALVGLLSRREPATARRAAKIPNGKAKRLVVKVKPRAKKKVAGRRRLLFKLRVRAGAAHATAYKRLRLVRR